MEISKTLYVPERADWRAWLERHHKTETEVWLIYYKKHTGRPTIPYDCAVEEALCFGWIDSTVKRIDDEKYAQRFTPRKDNKNWSDPNKKRVRKLMKEGKMTKAGLAKISDEVLSQLESSSAQKKREALVIPAYFKEALIANEHAWANFNNLAASYRSDYVHWVTSCKKEETRDRRLKEAVELLALNKKLGMK
jgi:uncharacterized protein YdeI (YjbR/CyaY-like superfamily)